jgi:hypothetical protein
VVTLYRELRKRKPDEAPAADGPAPEAPAAEAAVGTDGEAQPGELVELGPAAPAIEPEELQAA